MTRKLRSITQCLGVGVILKASLKDKVVHVNRRSDMIMSLMLVINTKSVNVISAYTSQVDMCEEEKKTFLDSQDEIVNGVYRGFGYGVRNEEGHSILEFSTIRELVVVNSFFKKRDSHLITFTAESGKLVAVKQEKFGKLLSCREGDLEDRIMAHERIGRRIKQHTCEMERGSRRQWPIGQPREDIISKEITAPAHQCSLFKPMGFDFVVEYKKGSVNVMADALSRKNEDLGSVRVITLLVPGWSNVIKEEH
ncbi:hypothetical protein Tco_0949717 [Tanacetum coccineum]